MLRYSVIRAKTKVLDGPREASGGLETLKTRLQEASKGLETLVETLGNKASGSAADNVYDPLYGSFGDQEHGQPRTCTSRAGTVDVYGRQILDNPGGRQHDGGRGRHGPRPCC